MELTSCCQLKRWSKGMLIMMSSLDITVLVSCPNRDFTIDDVASTYCILLLLKMLFPRCFQLQVRSSDVIFGMCYDFFRSRAITYKRPDCINNGFLH